MSKSMSIAAAIFLALTGCDNGQHKALHDLKKADIDMFNDLAAMLENATEFTSHLTNQMETAANHRNFRRFEYEEKYKNTTLSTERMNALQNELIPLHSAAEKRFVLAAKTLQQRDPANAPEVGFKLHRFFPTGTPKW